MPAPSLAASAERGLFAGDYEQGLSFDGRERLYSVHVPRGYTPDRVVPLVLNYHGGMGSPAQQRNDSCMDAVADQHGFVVVYPFGTGPFPRRGLTFNAGICCGFARDHNVDDVSFAEAIVTDIARFMKFDPARVFAAGFSNGGFMCYRLACERPKLFAGVAVVGAVQGVSMEGAEQGEPISLIHIHGRHDKNVNYDGGIGENAMEKTDRPSVGATIDFWIARNRCAKEGFDETRTGAAVCRRYKPGPDGKPVVLWTIEDGGHTWPGGQSTLPESMVGPVSHDINASEVIWGFFARETLE
jgi:polyhydroxybutyrate depolymerase